MINHLRLEMEAICVAVCSHESWDWNVVIRSCQGTLWRPVTVNQNWIRAINLTFAFIFEEPNAPSSNVLYRSLLFMTIWNLNSFAVDSFCVNRMHMVLYIAQITPMIRMWRPIVWILTRWTYRARHVSYSLTMAMAWHQKSYAECLGERVRQSYLFK